MTIYISYHIMRHYGKLWPHTPRSRPYSSPPHFARPLWPLTVVLGTRPCIWQQSRVPKPVRETEFITQVCLTIRGQWLLMILMVFVMSDLATLILKLCRATWTCGFSSWSSWPRRGHLDTVKTLWGSPVLATVEDRKWV